MKKGTLLLMEISIMLLVIAIGGALCIGGFVKANDISRGAADRDRAYIEMQNLAEVFKHFDGDIDKIAEHYGIAPESPLEIESGGLALILDVTLEEYLAVGRITCGEESLETVTQREVPYE